VGNSIKCLFQAHSDALPHRESKQGFATFRLLARRLHQLSHAAACSLSSKPLRANAVVEFRSNPNLHKHNVLLLLVLWCADFITES